MADANFWMKVANAQAKTDGKRPPFKSAWQRAKDSVPRCARCDDWERAGLSSRCPTCDAEILDRYDEMNKA